MESSACKFAVDFVETSGLCEVVFFPEFLDYASACFCSWQWGCAFCCLGRDLGEVVVFYVFGDGCEYAVDDGLDLVWLGFYFEFYVADFHLYA